jgi:hypothetical protein
VQALRHEERGEGPAEMASAGYERTPEVARQDWSQRQYGPRPSLRGHPTLPTRTHADGSHQRPVSAPTDCHPCTPNIRRSRDSGRPGGPDISGVDMDTPVGLLKQAGKRRVHLVVCIVEAVVVSSWIGNYRHAGHSRWVNSARVVVVPRGSEEFCPRSRSGGPEGLFVDRHQTTIRTA